MNTLALQDLIRAIVVPGALRMALDLTSEGLLHDHFSGLRQAHSRRFRPVKFTSNASAMLTYP